jgi:hypothetical protein
VDESSIADLCAATKAVLAKESHVVEVDGVCRLFGDVHGQLLDLLQVFETKRESEKVALFEYCILIVLSLCVID